MRKSSPPPPFSIRGIGSFRPAMLSLPYDALACVASWLRLADLASFRATCRRIRSVVSARSDLARVEHFVRSESDSGLASVVRIASKHLAKRQREYHTSCRPGVVEKALRQCPPDRVPSRCMFYFDRLCPNEATCKCPECKRLVCPGHASDKVCGVCGKMRGCAMCSSLMTTCNVCRRRVCEPCQNVGTTVTSNVGWEPQRFICRACTRDFCSIFDC